MARTMTPVDARDILALMVHEMTGQEPGTININSSNFTSVGESLFQYGKENVLNSLTTVLFRTYFDIRPFTSKYKAIRAESHDLFRQRLRKISYYAKDGKYSGNFNTDKYTNFAPGFTNGENPDGNGDPQSTKSQWEQDPPVPLEMHFGGLSVYQDVITKYLDKIEEAFENEDTFIDFVDGYVTEKFNDMESMKEGFSRLCVLNAIGMTYDMAPNMPGSCRNMTSAFNAEFGTSYTSKQLLTTYRSQFLAFLVSEIKKDSDAMENRSLNYHLSPPKQVDGVDYVLLRHTPKSAQKLLILSKFMIESEAYVLPAIFNPQYLDINNYEKIDFWMSENDKAAVDVTPAVYDISTGYQVQGARVQIPYLIGMMFDERAIVTDFRLQNARTTSVEARKGYYNTWYNVARQNINDPTHKIILYYLADTDLTASYTLTKVTSSNTAATLYTNDFYTTTLTPDSGYEITTVTVTMGGVDITTDVYDSDTGVITIPCVTGNIAITATATSNAKTTKKTE